MILPSTIVQVAIVPFVFFWAASHSFGSCRTQQQTEERHAFPLSTAYVPSPGQSTMKVFHIRVDWAGRQYGTAEGIQVLMRVIADVRTDPDERAKALETLATLWPWLRNTDRIPELIALYDTLGGRKEKRRLLACLSLSEDRRGLPLFARVLQHEKDEMVRLSAAIAFVHWNVRRGVAELVAHLDSDDEAFSQPVYSPYGQSIGDIVLGSFFNKSRDKGWGFSEVEIRKSIEAQAGLDKAEMKELYIVEMKAAVKKWFAENEDRFPDWKPGDPLPAAETPPPIPAVPGPDDVLSLSAAFLEPPAYGRTGQNEGYYTVGHPNEEELSWQGKRYPAREAVDVLMKVAMEPANVGDRVRAMELLGRRGNHLRSTRRIPQLMQRYARLTGRSEKVALLFCLAESKDRRALPLFGEILGTRQEDYLRLPAAYGLALWNVRCGVRELIELVSVKHTESPIRYPGIIGDKARRLLYRLNYWKFWWAPEGPLLAATGAGPEVRDELLASCHAELKKWFAENEHRFPDWNLGDPLPEVRPEEDKEAGEE